MKPPNFKLIAHRGASAEAPENTLSAMLKAVDIGVDFIEFDVRLSKEGIPIVIHDATISRTTNIKNPLQIHDLTIDQIKNLDSGSWFDNNYPGEKIPTLEEVLNAKLTPAKLMIEIKKSKHPPSVIVDSVAKVIENSPFHHASITIGSMSVPIIEELQKRVPHLKIIGITEKNQTIAHFLEREVKLIAIWHRLIDPSLVKLLSENNVDVWSFTIDDPKIIKHLQTLSVSGIITNHPRLIREHFFQ